MLGYILKNVFIVVVTIDLTVISCHPIFSQ